MTTTSSSSGCKKKWWRVADRRDKTLAAKKEKYIINPSAWRQERKSNHRHKEKKRGKHTCSLTDAKGEKKKVVYFSFYRLCLSFRFQNVSCRESKLTQPACLAASKPTDAGLDDVMQSLRTAPLCDRIVMLSVFFRMADNSTAIGWFRNRIFFLFFEANSFFSLFSDLKKIIILWEHEFNNINLSEWPTTNRGQ